MMPDLCSCCGPTYIHAYTHIHTCIGPGARPLDLPHQVCCGSPPVVKHHVVCCLLCAVSCLQFSGFIQLWALILTMIHTVCIVRGAKSAHFVEEATHVSMHGVPYLPMLAEAVGYKKLGSWRVSKRPIICMYRPDIQAIMCTVAHKERLACIVSLLECSSVRVLCRSMACM